MKPIDKMTNRDKAELLHGLFPEEIPAFTDYVKRVCLTIKENEEEERAKGEHGIIGFDFWLQMVNDTEYRIDRYGVQLHKRARLFADQLFDGQNALLMQYCLKLYTGVRKHDNQTFTDMVGALFKTDKIK
ncbi:hypothetical protein [Algoriphagus sp. Y33]|uniref:hypothetical protein n=1 Tax=Algoriphagus sp. Y33 TaxID=2772483 RepID=UPI001784B1EF|nr:hypothetical protein [Algoriphagus sp. Y33]